MKLNNNNQIPFINLSLLSIILICFTLNKCVAETYGSTILTDYELKTVNQNASSPKPSSDSEAPSSVPSSKAPDAQSPTNANAPDAQSPIDANAPGAQSPTNADAPDAQSPADAEAPDAQSPTDADAPDAQSPADANAPDAQSPTDANAPDAQSPTSGDSSGYSSSYSDAFSDILKGDPFATMPPQGGSNTKLEKNSEVEQICAHTQYPDICLKTIQPLLSQNTKIEITSALEVAIKACASQVKMTITKVEKHAATSPELANELVDCKEKYQNALKSLQSAIRCISDHDFGKLTVTLSSVMADVSTCESKFEDMKSSSTKSKTDGLVSMMVNNCISIASLVRH